ncbi:MAG TPA: class I SAM-dependent methyltransferase [Candidatus Paceibacterota bacterium]|nr:class I SAM-dependent methyltransferase [Candidatus Paceibacterota bacterium]
MDIRETYNRIAEDWHKDHTNDDWWTEETERFLNLLPTGGTVLDVGCGSGTKSKYMAGRGFQVTGIDISDGLLAIAKRELPEGDFRELSMTDLSSLSASYDGTFAQASLLHIPKKEAGDVVRQIASVTKPGGYTYIAVKELRPGNKDEEIKREDDYGYTYERFFSYYTSEELAAHFEQSGLTIISNTRKQSGNTVWLQIVGQRPALALGS